jgi:hypothetical protein
MKPIAPLLAVIFTVGLQLAHAEKNTDLKPSSTKPGKVQFEDNFDGSATLNAKWEIKKGTWQVKDGAIDGAMKKEDNHAGVLFLNVPNHNSVIRFSFQMAGGKGMSLSYNTEKGHLFRIQISTGGITIVKDKDKKDSKSKSDELATALGKLDANAWHTIQVEVNGGKVSVQTDSGLKAEASNSAIDANKTGFRFVTGGSIKIDDVKVWQVE